MTDEPKLNWKDQITNDFRNVIYVKEERNKFVTRSMEAIIFVTVLMAWFTYGFLPIMQHVDAYEKQANWDHILALSAIGGSLLPFMLILTFGNFYIMKYNAKLWGYLLQ